MPAPQAKPIQSAIKRAIDVAGSAVGLAATAPVLAAASLGVAAVMGRPVFFRQTRPGLRGVPFELLKLRTMKPICEDAQTDGERLTPLGRFLRSCSIDELPTLWNVAKGDMSLVGPRPLLMQYLERYSPEQRRRHDVKPGVTGLAQVSGRNALGWPEKLRLDVWYVDHWSLALDCRILVATVWNVLSRRGISHGESATMPEFAGET